MATKLTGWFTRVLELQPSGNCFSLNLGEGFYRQKFGISMGNPLVPVLCNLFMENLEATLLPHILPSPIVWHRYVDDVFCVWPDDQNFNVFFTNLNELHPSIKFTTEWEENGSIPFLDTKVINCNSKIKITVYRKPTASDGYIHYFSHHEESVKIATISGLLLRAYRICDPSLLTDEINRIFCIFNELQFLLRLIELAHIKARKTHFLGAQPKKSFKECLVVPYANSLAKLKSIFQQNDQIIAFKYNNTLKNELIRTSPKNDAEHGVYRIPCADCANSCYYGETGRSFNTRISEHKADIRRHNEKSSCFQHICNTAHRIDFDASTLVYKAGNSTERKIVENILISKYENFNLDPGKYQLGNLLQKVALKIISTDLQLPPEVV